MIRHCVCHFIIHSPEDGSSCGSKRTLKKYGTFLNSFYQEVKQHIKRLEQIKDKIGRCKVSVLFNQTCMCVSIYIYICVCVCVCEYICVYIYIHV